MKIKIKITKDVLRRSMICVGDEMQNCMVAVAIYDLFPEASVYQFAICFTESACDYYERNCFSEGKKFNNEELVKLPFSVTEQIKKFDELFSAPEKRLLLPEFSFEIEVPSSVIDKIGISQAYKVLSESKTLELLTEFTDM
jgi:hypothetical protein